MTQRILIGVGTATILILVGVWGYLFLYGTPENLNQVFSNLRTPETPFEETPATDPVGTINTQKSNRLAQLTTRPVAGFGTFLNNDSLIIRYAEKGTGHLYDIDMNTGAEERIDGVTLAKTSEAYFSIDGSKVVLVYQNNSSRQVILKANGQKDSDFSLPDNSNNFAWTTEGNLRYTTTESNGTVAYEVNNQSTKELWRIPLAEVRVSFGEGMTTIAPKPASRLSGAIYRIGNKLSRLVGPHYALTGIQSPSGQFLLTRYFNTESQFTVAKLIDTNNNQEIGVPLSAVPEKCVFNSKESRIWCASSANLLGSDRDSLNKWYRGEMISSDQLWTIESGWTRSEIISDFSSEAGFDVDVTNLQLSVDENYLMFKNKINDALWMYRVNEPPPDLETLQTEEETTDASVEQTPEQ